jgi:hypothetical protein
VHHPTPAVTTFESTPSTTAIEPSLERCVGELVAAAAGAIAEGLRERARGKLTTPTKMAGGDLIAELFRLRQFMIADWDFDGMCRTHGAAVLRETCGSEVSPATIDELVTAVLDILAKVVRAAVN